MFSYIPDICAYLVSGGPKTSQGIDDLNVYLAGVGLPGHLVAGVKSGVPGHQLVQALHVLGGVLVEQLHVAGLCARRALHTAEPEVLPCPGHGPLVHEEVTNPQTCTLPHRRQLGGLVVGVAQSGEVLVLLCKIR